MRFSRFGTAIIFKLFNFRKTKFLKSVFLFSIQWRISCKECKECCDGFGHRQHPNGRTGKRKRCDLTVTLMVMINALLLNQSSEARGLMEREMFPYQTEQQNRNNFQLAVNRIGRKNKRLRNVNRRNWYLDPIVVKLENVIDKYELRKRELETLYSGVVVCGLGKCQKFQGLIPENQKVKLKCTVPDKRFKKMALKLLAAFHEGVQRIDKSFQVLIEFEKWPNLNDGNRKKLLEEFKTDIKTLNIEIESVMINKRLNFGPVPNFESSPLMSRPKYKSHLLIYEWRIIQDSKRFLQDWRKNLRKVVKCWKRKKKQKRLKAEEGKKMAKQKEIMRERSFQKKEKMEVEGMTRL